MGYVINQYNRPAGIDTDNIFMTYTTDSWEIAQREVQMDIEVSGLADDFKDECVRIKNNGSLKKDVSYYFHGKIKRMMNSDQSFNIKLCYFDPSGKDKKVTQFIKNIIVAIGSKESSSNDLWVDVEFIFTPLQNFDCILFELQRNVGDFNKSTIRFPLIAYEELSIIKNVLLNSNVIREVADNKEIKLIKLGVQSAPGFLMCINQEEIHVGRTGIYEIKNGVITVSAFSVVNAATEDNNKMKVWLEEIVEELGDNDYNNDGQGKPIKACACFFDTSSEGYPKTRTINGFTLDYMFKENPINSSTPG